MWEKRLLWLGIVCCFISACSTSAQKTITKPAPSIAGSKTVEFLGKRFTRKFQDANQVLRFYEYFPEKQTPTDWWELVDFQVYAPTPKPREPIDYARTVTGKFSHDYAQSSYHTYINYKTGTVILELIYPRSTRKDAHKKFFEFSAFKFYRDSGSGQVIVFHYARNIEAAGPERGEQSVRLEIKRIRDKVLHALTGFPDYQP